MNGIIYLFHLLMISLRHLRPVWQTFSPVLPADKERGQGLVEYALIVVLVAIVAIAVLVLVGPAIQDAL